MWTRCVPAERSAQATPARLTLRACRTAAPMARRCRRGTTRARRASRCSAASWTLRPPWRATCRRVRELGRRRRRCALTPAVPQLRMMQGDSWDEPTLLPTQGAALDVRAPPPGFHRACVLHDAPDAAARLCSCCRLRRTPTRPPPASPPSLCTSAPTRRVRACRLPRRRADAALAPGPRRGDGRAVDARGTAPADGVANRGVHAVERCARLASPPAACPQLKRSSSQAHLSTSRRSCRRTTPPFVRSCGATTKTGSSQVRLPHQARHTVVSHCCHPQATTAAW